MQVAGCSSSSDFDDPHQGGYAEHFVVPLTAAERFGHDILDGFDQQWFADDFQTDCSPVVHATFRSGKSVMFPVTGELGDVEHVDVVNPGAPENFCHLMYPEGGKDSFDLLHVHDPG